MKKLMPFLITLPLLALAFASPADEQPVDDVTIDLAESRPLQGVEQSQRQTKASHSSIIIDYMLERGDISQAELDARQAERNAVRAELQALKASGDRTALKARIAELRQEREQQREATKAYVENNEDLKAALQEQRNELQTQREEQRAQREEKRAQRQEQKEARAEHREQREEQKELRGEKRQKKEGRG